MLNAIRPAGLTGVFTQKPVPRELVRNLVDVARQRSCGRNGQGLRYVSVTHPENVEAMQPMLHWAAALPKEIGTPKEGEQPVAFIVVTKPGDANPVISNIDLGIALDAMAITAWQQGWAAPSWPRWTGRRSRLCWNCRKGWK